MRQGVGAGPGRNVTGAKRTGATFTFVDLSLCRGDRGVDSVKPDGCHVHFVFVTRRGDRRRFGQADLEVDLVRVEALVSHFVTGRVPRSHLLIYHSVEEIAASIRSSRFLKSGSSRSSRSPWVSHFVTELPCFPSSPATSRPRNPQRGVASVTNSIRPRARRVVPRSRL